MAYFCSGHSSFGEEVRETIIISDSVLACCNRCRGLIRKDESGNLVAKHAFLRSDRNGETGMVAKDPVGQFVRDALIADRSRADIRNALSQAGWSDHEANDALAEFSEVEFTPPIPRPRPQFTARDVFIYAVLFTALAFAATYLINLILAILDLRLPDSADSEWVERSATRKMRWSIAGLIVSAPVYFWMSLYTSRSIEKDEGHRRSLVRKWLTYIALFVAALTFFGDATYLIYKFLQGEATLRFLLKAATVAIVTLAIFAFYLRDVEYLKGEP
jgi:hypothetical protein